MDDSDALAQVVALHDEVDAWVAELEQLHAERLTCRLGCSRCCVDELTVLEVEALRIRARHGDFLASAQPGPKGACAMLDQAGGCRIYADRPYVCRTQGLPLRWLEERADGEWVEYRDICPLNEEGPPIEGIDLTDCWSLGIYEPRLADLQETLQAKRGQEGELVRVSLRGLFAG